MSAHVRPRRPGSRHWRSLAAVLAVVAVVCGVGAAARDRSPDAPPAAQTIVEPAVPAPGTDDPRPVGLTIPDLALETPLVSLGLNDDRTVEVPSDPDRAGWYRLGPAPGEPGSAVVLGHVDSLAGPAVFHRLGTLRPGARVQVTRADGSVARFTVRTVTTYPRAEFPATEVYRNTGRPALTLVTCGGAYDRSRGGYQANVVVVAE